MKHLPKILSAAQLKETDQHTMLAMDISSLQLMEQAANAFVQYLMSLQIARHKIVVFCGSGNNGGDGLAICRMLIENGFDAQAYFIDVKKIPSDDCTNNLNRLSKVEVIESESQLPQFNQSDIIIDALFGIGIHGKVEGLLASVIQAINNSGNTVYAVDMPSGLPTESITQSENVINADFVVTFQRPKTSFFFPEHKLFVKDWAAIDIGLAEDYIQQLDAKTFYINHEVQQCVKPRKKFSHKGHFGHALLMAGSFGKMGAAVLSAHACLKSGVGLLTTHVPKCGVDILQTSVPEAMCMPDNSNQILTHLPDLQAYNVIAIGPGIGRELSTANMFCQLLKKSDVPMVIDADAINILSENPDWTSHIPKGSILTPHIKEFDRLMGDGTTLTTERMSQATSFAIKYQCVLVMKDACTWVFDQNGNRYVHNGGNPGMATAGSGDVLTGVITGLLAQGYSSTVAACIAVYNHGLAGDKAAKKTGQMGLMASDIIKHLKID